MRTFALPLTLALGLFVTAASGAPPASAGPSPAQAAPVYVAMGDSVTLGYEATKPYPQLVSATFGERLTNLAKTGAIAASVYEEQVPFIPSGCALVSVDIGFDDANGIVDHNGVTIDDYARYMNEIVTASHEACPKAPILVFTIINELRGKAVAEQENAIIRKLPGVTVVDIAKDPTLRDASLFNPDTIHPNDAGHCAIARDVLRAMGTPASAAPLSC